MLYVLAQGHSGRSRGCLERMQSGDAAALIREQVERSAGADVGFIL